MNHTSRPIDVLEVELQTVGNHRQWDWLTPRRMRLGVSARGDAFFWLYKFPGCCGLELTTDLVINHHLFQRKQLPSRRPLDGFLLGIGGRMPADLIYGGWIDLNLEIVSVDHGKYPATMSLWTERLDPHYRPPRTTSAILERARANDYVPGAMLQKGIIRAGNRASLRAKT